MRVKIGKIVVNFRYLGSCVLFNIFNSEWVVDFNGFGLLVLVCFVVRVLGKVLDLLEVVGCEDMILV